MPMLRALAAMVAAHPNRPALVLESGTVRYADFHRQVDRLARALYRHGLVPGDVVGLTVAEPHRHLVASFALMRLGCTHVMLPAHEPAELLAEVATRCGVCTVVTEDAAQAPAGLGAVIADFEWAFGSTPTEDPAPPHADPDAPAVILASSGTTGRPKLVPLSQRQLLAQAGNGRKTGGHETLYRPISIEYNNAKRQALYALCLGATNILVDAPLSAVAETCRAHGVSALMGSPAQARALIDGGTGDGHLLPSTTRMFLSGSLVGPGFVTEARRRLTPQVDVVYGITECARISIAGPGDEDGPDGCVGRPLPGVAVEIVDEADRPLPAGEAGILRVRTPGMAARYVDDAALSARAFRGGWFYPGDMGALLTDGRLVHHGRQDDMMNLNTIKVFPAEIERAMQGYPGVVECAAFPLRSPVHGDIPILAVVADDCVDLTALLAFGRERLGIRAPRKIVPIDRLPRNAAGKVVVAELRGLVGG